MLEITHTVAEGSLLAGTSRGDGSAEVVKPLGWRWGRSIGCWYLPHSRDRRADAGRLETCRTALVGVGFDVEVRMDDTMPGTAELERGKIERQQRRVDALAARSATAERAAQAADAAADAAFDRLPPAGEPIKIGHHSEGRHRRAIERAGKAMDKAVTAGQVAAEAARRHQTASHTTGARYAPQTVANRIAKLEAEIRATQRAIDGHTRGRGDYAIQIAPATGAYLERLQHQLAEQTDALQYWQKVRAEQVETGTATNYSRATIAAGDQVRICGQWRRVVRANPTTVSVETDYTWTDRAPYSAIQDHRPPAE